MFLMIWEAEVDGLIPSSALMNLLLNRAQLHTVNKWCCFPLDVQGFLFIYVHLKSQLTKYKINNINNTKINAFWVSS